MVHGSQQLLADVSLHNPTRNVFIEHRALREGMLIRDAAGMGFQLTDNKANQWVSPSISYESVELAYRRLYRLDSERAVAKGFEFQILAGPVLDCKHYAFPLRCPRPCERPFDSTVYVTATHQALARVIFQSWPPYAFAYGVGFGAASDMETCVLRAVLGDISRTISSTQATVNKAAAERQ